MRNFEACLDFAEKNLDPDERPKFNDCLERVSNIPLGIVWLKWLSLSVFSVIEFGDILIKLAPLVRRWAILLSKLSDFCMADPTAEQTNLEKQRRLIQSCMDACRYAWPLFNHMSRLIIPLQQEPAPHRFLVSAWYLPIASFKTPSSKLKFLKVGSKNDLDHKGLCSGVIFS